MQQATPKGEGRVCIVPESLPLVMPSLAIATTEVESRNCDIQRLFFNFEQVSDVELVTSK